MNVHKVHAAASVGEFADETVDSLLIAAEDKSCERPRGRRHASKDLNVRIGRMGPNISSSMILSSQVMGYRSVGSRECDCGSELPPAITLEGSMSEAKRSTARALMMRE